MVICAPGQPTTVGEAVERSSPVLVVIVYLLNGQNDFFSFPPSS